MTNSSDYIFFCLGFAAGVIPVGAAYRLLGR
jgi:hypothetical protein